MGLYFRARLGPITYVERLDDGQRRPAPPDTHGWPGLGALLWSLGAILLFVVVPCLVTAVLALR